MFLFQSVNVPLSGAVESCPGGRDQNQDDFGVAETPLGFVAIVCDGMGGGPGGKTASAIVKQTVLATLCGCNQLMDRATALKMAVSRANDALADAVRRAPELAGMGSTLVAVLIDRQSALVAHVGDSRCYRLHGRRVKFCTEDHSLVAELVRKRVMTAEQARISPQSNVITRHLGNPVNNTPQIDEVAFCRGDRFVLCTDGVWGSMPQAKLTAAMAMAGNADCVVERLAQLVDSIGFAEGGGHDNHTVLMIDIAADSEFARKAIARRKWILASVAGAFGVAAIVALACMFKGCGGQSADDAATQHYPSEGDPSYIYDGRTRPIAIADSSKADSVRGDSAAYDTAAAVRRIEKIKRGRHRRDSLKAAEAKEKATKAKEKETEAKEKAAKVEGKKIETKPGGKAGDTTEQKAVAAIKAAREKLEAIRNRKEKQAEAVTKANTKSMKAVTRQLDALKAMNMSRYKDFIESVCEYVADRNNMALLTRPSAKPDDKGFYSTDRKGIALTNRIEKDLVRLEQELKKNK